MTLAEYFNASDLKLTEAEALTMFNEDIAMRVINETISQVVNVGMTYDDTVFGQLSMIEQILSSDMSQIEKVTMCLANFFRPVADTVFDNSDRAKEESLVKFFADVPAKVGLVLFDIFMGFREDFFYNRYNGVIYQRKESDEPRNEPQEKPNDFETWFYDTFGWYEKQRAIAKELNMTIDAVMNMNSNAAMVELSYQKSRARLDSIREKTRK